MKEKHNRYCKVCGTSFYGCDGCYEFKTFYPWKTLCDTQQHYQVWQIIMMYRDKVINEVEVKESLERIKIGIDEIKTFIPAVQDILLPIMEVKEEIFIDDIVDAVNEEETAYTKSKRK